jgi:hypothetical protein
MKWTMAAIKAKNAKEGYNYFDKETMRFFRSRVESGPYQGAGGIFFVTSEQFVGSYYTDPRKYSVRRFFPETGACCSFGEFNRTLHLEDAREDAKAAARGKR